MGALDDNLTRLVQMRDRRAAMPAANGSLLAGGRLIGAPSADPNWEAFFGALHDQADTADANGQNFRLRVGNVGNVSPALAGLHRAMGGTT